MNKPLKGASSLIPLAEKLRPQQLEDIVGQPHLLGPGGWITRTIKSKNPLSILLWGPPGCGKTSIARLYAKAFGLHFESLNATFSGIGDLRKLVQQAEESPLFKKGTVIFVDELHRFNKAQQDAFLPFVERGTFVLVGATAENPSFYLNGALLSRLHVLQLKALDKEALLQLIVRYETLITPLPLGEGERNYLVELSQGDGRYLYNLIESVSGLQSQEPIAWEALQESMPRRAALYDRQGEQHYHLVSALHKAIRGSDPDAAMYWFARMLEGGEDPLFLARRLIRMASEDIGQADPQALPLALAAHQAYHMLGSPEGELALAQAVIYLALAPKSHATYTAYNQARAAAAETTHFSPPATILNAHTNLEKTLGYGDGYSYDHDTSEGFSGQNYFPDKMGRHSFYKPVKRGFEREMAKRLTYFTRLRQHLQGDE